MAYVPHLASKFRRSLEGSLDKGEKDSTGKDTNASFIDIVLRFSLTGDAIKNRDVKKDSDEDIVIRSDRLSWITANPSNQKNIIAIIPKENFALIRSLWPQELKGNLEKSGKIYRPDVLDTAAVLYVLKSHEKDPNIKSVLAAHYDARTDVASGAWNNPFDDSFVLSPPSIHYIAKRYLKMMETGLGMEERERNFVSEVSAVIAREIADDWRIRALEQAERPMGKDLEDYCTALMGGSDLGDEDCQPRTLNAMANHDVLMDYCFGLLVKMGEAYHNHHKERPRGVGAISYYFAEFFNKIINAIRGQDPCEIALINAVDKLSPQLAAAVSMVASEVIQSASGSKESIVDHRQVDVPDMIIGETYHSGPQGEGTSRGTP